MMTKRILLLMLALCATGCVVSRKRPPPAAPVGATGCGSPIECYEKALQALSDTQAYWQTQQATLALVPAGTVVAFAGGEVPEGWLLCDGSTLSKNDPKYKRLFEVIGTTHGGDASPSFQIPDYRGLFLRGADPRAARDPDAARRRAPGTNGSGNAGPLVGSIQDDSLGKHSHSTRGVFQEAEGGKGFHGAGFASNSQPQNPNQYGTSEAGGSETRPKNAYVNYIIKL